MIDILSVKKNKLTSKLIFNNVDIAIITATDTEFREVLNNLEDFGIITDKKCIFHHQDVESNLNYYFGSLSGFKVCLLQALAIGNAVDGAALFTISQLIKKIKPRCIMMLGVCCGMEAKKKCRKVPIYIANLITYYEYAKIDNGTVINRAASAFPNKLLSIFKEIETEEYCAKKGMYLCGEKVINDKEIKEKLQKMYPGSVALDMESYSLAILANDIPYVVIKGASDFGVAKKGSENQAKTMQYVIAYVKSCLKECDNKFSPRKQQLSVFISGSCESDCKDYSPYFIHELLMALYNEGYTVVNGYGKGIGEHIVIATQQFSFVKKVEYNSILRLYPFPRNNKLVNEAQYNAFATNNRKQMCKDSDISLFLYGNKRYDDKPGTKLDLAKGVLEEYHDSIDEKNIIVPLGATGYAAANVYSQYSAYIREYKNAQLQQYFDRLDTHLTYNKGAIETYIKDIVKYIDQMIQCNLLNSVYKN